MVREEPQGVREMNNAEYLRNLSDEKLAAWLWNHIDFNTFCCEMCQSTAICNMQPLVLDCANEMMVWLQQEHKE